MNEAVPDSDEIIVAGTYTFIVYYLPVVAQFKLI